LLFEDAPKKCHFMKRNYVIVLFLLFAVTGKLWAQAPIISSFGPTSGPLGTGVTINGSGFSAIADSNVVYFGATQALVNSATASQLSVTVKPGATYQPITVINKTTKLVAQSALSFSTTFSPADTTFDAVVNLTPAIPVADVQVADIDGDGKPDIIATSPAAHLLLVFLNQSQTGTITPQSFAAPLMIPTGQQPGIVSIGDMDGDGKPDILLMNVGFARIPNTNNSLTFFHNTSTPGTIKLTPAIITDSTATTSLSYNFPLKTNDIAARVGDFDGDGRPDIAVLNSGGFISIYPNTYAPGDSLKAIFGARDTVAVGLNPTSFAVAGMVNTGKPDLLTTNYGSSSLSVLYNTSSPGSFSFTRIDFPLNYTPLTISINDVDGDGKLDAVIGTPNNGLTTLIHNTSVPGHFSAESIVLTNVNAISDYNNNMVLQDISGDGDPDILSLSPGQDSVFLYTNKSTPGQTKPGYFSNYSILPIVTIPDCVVDMDGDGRPDVVIGSLFGIEIYHGKYFPPVKTVALRTDSTDMVIYPNPTTSSTNIRYYLPVHSDVLISVYSVTGKLLTSVTTGDQAAGGHTNILPTASFKPGVYVIKLVANNYNKAGKLIVQPNTN
jgi:hypothetical protein